MLFTTSPGKTEDALRLGADEVVLSKNASEMAKHRASFNFILDAVSAQHDINAYLDLLKLDGTLTLVGAPEKPLPVAAFNVIIPRRNFAGSAIGGIAETQEMLDSLRRQQHHQRCREDSDSGCEHGLRAAAEERCEIPVCDRYEVAERIVSVVI